MSNYDHNDKREALITGSSICALELHKIIILKYSTLIEILYEEQRKSQRKTTSEVEIGSHLTNGMCVPGACLSSVNGTNALSSAHLAFSQKCDEPAKNQHIQSQWGCNFTLNTAIFNPTSKKTITWSKQSDNRSSLTIGVRRRSGTELQHQQRTHRIRHQN
jgi:hypothetical protein